MNSMESVTPGNRWLAAARAHWRPAVRSRYFWLGLFVAGMSWASVKIGEHYPFSHFPMYGDPDPGAVEYYFLTDAQGEPLPVAGMAGDTAPKLKKRLNTLLREWSRDNGLKTKTDVPAEVRKGFARDVLDGFVRQSKQRGTPLPDKVQLWRGDIFPTPQGYREAFEKEAEN
jgi:hypothetical protein